MRTPRPGGGCHQCWTSPSRKLARRAAQQVLAQQTRLGVDQRHRVLQLIAEAERAARLVEAAARPQAAGQRLVEQPAVGQHVERRVGRLDLHGAERVLSSSRCTASSASRARGDAAEALHQIARRFGAGRSAEAEDDLALLLRRPARTATLDRRARVERGADACRTARARASRPDCAACRCGRGTRRGRRSRVARRRRRRRRTRPVRRTRCCRRCARTARRCPGRSRCHVHRRFRRAGRPAPIRRSR